MNRKKPDNRLRMFSDRHRLKRRKHHHLVILSGIRNYRVFKYPILDSRDVKSESGILQL